MSIQKKEKDGFSFARYIGDGSVLLAFNLEENKTDNLAGFALRCKAPHIPTYATDEYWVQNKLNFEKVLVAKKKTKQNGGLMKLHSKPSIGFISQMQDLANTHTQPTQLTLTETKLTFQTVSHWMLT